MSRSSLRSAVSPSGGVSLPKSSSMLHRGCTVKGHGWAAPGVSAGDGVEVLFLGDYGQRRTTRLGRDGNFMQTSLSPGHWQVVLTTRGYREVPVRVPPGAGQRLKLTPGQSVELELIMLPVR